MKRDPSEPTTDGYEAAPGWFWPVVGLAVVLTFPYYFSLETFFSHDDFAILWFHKDWPVWQPWRFLDPHVLTFYRPLQSYVFAVLFQLFGMTPFPYCLLLVLIHLTNVILFGRFVDRMFNDRSLALLSVIFFATNWEYCAVVFWKGNYGTALSWLFVLAAANAFLDHLRERRRRTFLLALGLVIAALLSKETAVNAPLLLTLVYGMWLWRPKEPDDDDSRFGDNAPVPKTNAAEIFAKLRAAAVLLGPFYALIGVYGLFHVWVVQDVYDWLPKGYEISKNPGDWFGPIVRALSVWLTWWLDAGVEILSTSPRYPGWYVWLNRHYYLLPVAMLLAGVVLRNRQILFGLLWGVLAFLPANLIEDPHASRYYYGSIMGVSLIYAEIFIAADRAIVRRWSSEVVAPTRVIGSLLILAFVSSGMFYTTSIVGNDARACRRIEDVYRFLSTDVYRLLSTQQGQIPPKSLFLARCLNPKEHFHYGMGLREMFKLALEEDEVEAILQPLDEPPTSDQPLTVRTRTILLTEYPPAIKVVPDGKGWFELKFPEITTGTATPSPLP